MTSRNIVLGLILPIIIMSFCLFSFIIPDETLFFSFALIHLLILFAYICALAVISKKKNLINVFTCAYCTIAIPFILGLLFVITGTLQELENTFFNSSISFDNLVFLFFLGGFVSAVDVVGTVRLFYNPYSPNSIYDILFVSIITAILLITPILIYKLTKSSETKKE